MDVAHTAGIDAGLTTTLNAAAIAAGAVILDVRARGYTVEKKYDSSPVTEADQAAEALILDRLREAAPGVPVIAEESVYSGRVPEIGDEFFLVDPLDGTREFSRGGDDFTVNIGLIRTGEAVAGVIFVPATGVIYWGSEGAGSWRATATGEAVSEPSAITIRRAPEAGIDVVASRSHRTRETDDFIARFDVRRLVSAGSSLKFCVVAAGEADLYPRMGTTMQWDTAAGDAILRAAGGQVVTLDGARLAYGPIGDVDGPERFRNPWFVATGGVDPMGSQSPFDQP